MRARRGHVQRTDTGKINLYIVVDNLMVEVKSNPSRFR